MRPTERGQAIAFLLSIGAIPLGCSAEDEGEPDTNATAPTTTAGSTASTTAGTDGTDSDVSMSSTASSTASTTASTTESTTVSTDATDATDVSVGTDPDTGYGTYGSGSSGGDACKGIDIPENCSQYVAHYVECFPGLQRYEEFKAEYCACMITYYGPMYGPNCATALEDYFACLSEVPCELMGADACPTEDVAMVNACGGGEDSGGGE